MHKDLFDRSVVEMIGRRAGDLERHFKAAVVSYLGPIHPLFFQAFRDFVEDVRSCPESPSSRVIIFLRTPGGVAETVERMVNVFRKHYDEVCFVVPDFAMSAGTILCLSGDKIFMDYTSSLGPIDPQVPTPDTGYLVPALGYLDKIQEMVEKGELTPADVVMLKSVDLARLAQYEQARDLSIDLLQKWLVDFKFRNWNIHRTTNSGAEVTQGDKVQRAREIAEALADHKRWRSHGRHLDLGKLRELRIEIEDYSDDRELRELVRAYSDALTGFVDRQRVSFALHNLRVGLYM